MIGRMLRNTWRYLSGVALVLMIVWGSAAIQRKWGIKFDSTFLVILAMIGTAWFKGLGPGLLVAALFELILDYYAYQRRDLTTFWVGSTGCCCLSASSSLRACGGPPRSDSARNGKRSRTR